MKSEKLTVNFTPTEIAQMDFLTQRGLYPSRSELIRMGVFAIFQKHDDEMKEFVKPQAAMIGGKHVFGGIGVIMLTKGMLQELRDIGEKASIRVIGRLIISNDVSAELLRETISSVRSFGAIQANGEIMETLAELDGMPRN